MTEDMPADETVARIAMAMNTILLVKHSTELTLAELHRHMDFVRALNEMTMQLAGYSPEMIQSIVDWFELLRASIDEYEPIFPTAQMLDDFRQFRNP